MSNIQTTEDPLLYHATTVVFDQTRQQSVTATVPVFPADDRELILRSWTSVRRCDVGRYTFLKLFRRRPELRERVFGFSTVPASIASIEDPNYISLESDDRFQHHITIFTSVLDSVIVEVGCNERFQEKTDPILLGLGAKHAKILHGSRYLMKKPDYWDCFKEAVAASMIDVYRFSNTSSRSALTAEDAMVSRQRSNTLPQQPDVDELRKLHRAWINFMSYVAVTIRQGYDAEISKTKQKRFNRFFKKSFRKAGLLIFGLVTLTIVIVVMVFVSRAGLPLDAHRQHTINLENSMYLEKYEKGDGGT